MNLSHFVPSATLLYLIAGVALGIIGTFLFVPTLRRWLSTEVRPKLNEVVGDLVKLAREPRRLALILLGCAGTTLGAALALWASIEAFGGERHSSPSPSSRWSVGRWPRPPRHPAASVPSRRR